LQLVQLQSAQSRFRERGIGLAGVSYDSQAILREFSERHGITYPLLADPRSAIIKRFRVLNGKAKDFMKGMASPGYIYISNDGRILQTFFEENYRERYTANNVIARLFPELTETDVRTLTAPHVTLHLGQSDLVVGPGSRIILFVEVTLPPDVHVYAPGAQGDKPILLQLDSASEFKSGPIGYPKSQTLYLPAINEKMPVFSGTFRIAQDVTVSVSPEFIRALHAAGDAGKGIAVHGTLHYQACDDKKCFLPESVSFSWPLTVMPPDLKRASEAIRHPGNP